MPIRGATSARSRRDLPQSPALTLGPNADESRMRRHGRSSSSHLSSLLLFFILGPLHLVIRSGFSLQPPSQSSTRRYSRSVYQEENGLLAGCKTESSQSILTRHSEWGFPFFALFCHFVAPTCECRYRGNTSFVVSNFSPYVSVGS